MADTTEAAGTAAEIARAEAEAEQAHGGGEPQAAAVEEGAEFASPPGDERARELARTAREARESGTSDVLHVADDPSLEARDRAASGAATDEDWAEVTEWLLTETPEVIIRELRLRVGGGDDDPKIIPWVVKAIPMAVIKQAEREATQGAAANRSQRRQAAGGPRQYDDVKANLRVIVEGTMKPDLKELAAQQGLRDAAVLVQRRFAYRPGVMAQLAGEIMSISGFDDADVEAAGQ